MIENSPVIVALLALLALPGATSAVTSLLRYLTDGAGVQPKVVVYIASLAVTLLVLVTGSVELPGWTGDPASFVGAWLVWGTANAELARRVYELLWERLAPPAA